MALLSPHHSCFWQDPEYDEPKFCFEKNSRKVARRSDQGFPGLADQKSGESSFPTQMKAQNALKCLQKFPSSVPRAPGMNANQCRPSRPSQWLTHDSILHL
jgi:hypothetical protein